MTDGAPGSKRISQSVRAPGRARHLTAEVSPSGEIRISGQEVSNGVLENDEFSSYQWTWVVRAADVPGALAVLGGGPGEDAVAVLDRWLAANSADPGMTISRAGVPIELTNHMGE